jgi:hypothetical protein
VHGISCYDTANMKLQYGEIVYCLISPDLALTSVYLACEQWNPSGQLTIVATYRNKQKRDRKLTSCYNFLQVKLFS